MKPYRKVKNAPTAFVVPRAGTWIETPFRCRRSALFCVVPRAGTWIEIRQPPAHPSNTGVVPRVGTWIEIHEQECFKQIGIVVSLTEIRIKILKLQWEK